MNLSNVVKINVAEDKQIDEDLDKEEASEQEVEKLFAQEKVLGFRPSLVEDSKQKMINKIMAAGLNSLHVSYNQDDKACVEKVLKDFPLESLACFDNLSAPIQISLMKIHLSDFKKYLASKGE